MPTTINCALVEITLFEYPARRANDRTLFVYGTVSVMFPLFVIDGEFVVGAVPLVV
jgi:hypothetical protein